MRYIAILTLGVDDVQWISDALVRALEDVPPSVTVDTKIFVTAAAEDAQAWDDDSTEYDSAGEAPNGSNGTKQPRILRFQQGRPDLKSLLDREISQANGAISVNGAITYPNSH